eukprot:Blabericola_migrator_1__2453@NODE_1690_length_3992_cov_57_535796_g345_i1_p3_GENE_NODE_1690_length_3992_cov_57_535796_g345_i1NODE_1690_length_3992_cov_57_535796_g345_i1_p3_ORF_typecomplete_len115_score22_82DHFR_1/PF00186_19/3e28_NODE_1690_length_3992_cov_57_535796_g345_i17851129
MVVASILASTCGGGIGLKGKLPWRLHEDLRVFERLTKGLETKQSEPNAVIMGRKTFESLPGGALKGRLNYVITSKAKESTDNVIYCESLNDALSRLKRSNVPVGFIAGGSLHID